jgi:hypothetical protein
MPVMLNEPAEERSTYVVTARFKDQAGGSVTPDTVKWSLTDSRGVILNNKENQVIAVPASVVDIVLYGDDLKIIDPSKDVETRVVVVEATYSYAGFTDLPLNDEVMFSLNNLRKVV